MLSRIDIKGIAMREEPSAEVISTKVYVSFFRFALKGGRLKGGNPSAIFPVNQKYVSDLKIQYLRFFFKKKRRELQHYITLPVRVNGSCPLT